jgi:outer membrane lipoprotein-sorting protein
MMLEYLLLFMFAFIHQAQPGDQTALSIIKKSDELMRGKTMSGRYTMKVVRPAWERSMTFDFWSEGTEKSFIRMESPAKNKGITFLKIDREMWNYIPKINRVIKIPPSMMMQSWMGSDFTNDDLVKESSVVTDYTHTWLRQEQEAGFDAYVIELKPKEEAAVVWDKVVEWIRADDYIPLKAEYFNERGEKIRTVIFSEIKSFGNRTLPARMELIEEKKKGHRTVMILEDATFDAPIPGSIFTKENLRK